MQTITNRQKPINYDQLPTNLRYICTFVIDNANSAGLSPSALPSTFVPGAEILRSASNKDGVDDVLTPFRKYLLYLEV